MSVNLGSIWWSVQVANAAEAANKAERMQEQLGQTAEKANRANEAVNDASRDMGKYEQETDRAANTAGRFGGTLGLVTTALFFLGSQMLSVIGITGTFSSVLSGAGIASAAATAGGAIKSLGAWLYGALAGGISTAISWISSFVSWLLAGSAAAYAVGAAIGALLGLFGVWVLEVFGVLDAIQRLGSWIANVLPAWVTDAILAIVGAFIGWLAVLGGFIIGFIEGGFDKAFQRAGQIIDIFFGSMFRTADRAMGHLEDLWGLLVDITNDAWEATLNILGGAKGYVEDTLEALREIANNTWESVIEIATELPGVDQVQEEVNKQIEQNNEQGGGDSLEGIQDFGDLIEFGINPNIVPPWMVDGGLAAGGIVTQPTTALIGEGSEPEAVMPLSDLDAMLSDAATGGGGGRTVVIEGVQIEIGDQSLDISRLTRSQMRRLAEEIAPELGREVEKIISNP